MDGNYNLERESLIVGLQERYSSIHHMRERIQTITFRILGILLGVSGRIIESSVNFSCEEKNFFIITILAIIIIFYRYFENLKKGVISQFNVATKIEEKLGFFDSSHGIYPQSWNKPRKSWPFLKSHYEILGFGFTILIISILFFT